LNLNEFREGLVLDHLVIEWMSLWQHTLMQDADDEDPSNVLPVKDNVPAFLNVPQSRANVITGPPQTRIFSDRPATALKFVQIADELSFSPGLKGVPADAHQVSVGAA
jgi:hypothetical protein